MYNLFHTVLQFGPQCTVLGYMELMHNGFHHLMVLDKSIYNSLHRPYKVVLVLLIVSTLINL